MLTNNTMTTRTRSGRISKPPDRYEPKEEVIEVAPVDLSAIEVEKKGKEAKEGESEESAEPVKEKEKEAKK